MTSEDAEIEVDEKTLADVLAEPDFKKFVDAQLTWDRGMAEGLFKARQKFPGAVVVGIVGAGHVASGYGIPHQLKSLGVSEQASLLPVASNAACKLVGTGYADAMFALPAVSEGPSQDRPRLGVLLVDDDGGARIRQVVPNSVAEAAGLKAGDQVVNAAGIETKSSDDLAEVVAVQAPGTWLPMSIKRDGQQIDVIAKFPPRPRS
jgi:membrane-associated protease RseP (regulator of RpoE activity)